MTGCLPPPSRLHPMRIALVSDTHGLLDPKLPALPRTAAILSLSGRHVRVAFFDLCGDPAMPWGEPVEIEL